MRMEEHIKKAVEEALKPIHLEVINESDRHIGHAGHDGSGESHFKLVVVSDSFEGCSRVERQRLVNASLKNLLESKLHALSMRCLTGSEYKKAIK